MAEHEISISIPPKMVQNVDVVFEVYSDGEKLGELHVSKGTIDWHPRNLRRIASLSWEQFDRIMRDRIGADGRR